MEIEKDGFFASWGVYGTLAILVGIMALVTIYFTYSYITLLEYKEDAEKKWIILEYFYINESSLVQPFISRTFGSMGFELNLIKEVATAKTNFQYALNSNNNFEIDKRGFELNNKLTDFLYNLSNKNYAGLEMDSQFLYLKSELLTIQKNLAVARKNYIDSAEKYNKMRKFPNIFTAKLFDFKEMPYYK
jgi:hypothetical protein